MDNDIKQILGLLVEMKTDLTEVRTKQDRMEKTILNMQEDM